MFKIKNTSIILFLLLLSSCEGPLTYEDSGSIIELSEDVPFQIILEGDATSEFTWQLISKNTYVKQEKPVTVTTDANKKIYTFDFKTISNGTQRIEIIYSNGSEIKKTFQLDVIIGSIGLITAKGIAMPEPSE